MAKNAPPKLHANTRLAQAGGAMDHSSGAVTPAIQLATTFARDENYAPKTDWIYSRYGAPNMSDVETLLCDLEGAQSALIFASGLAAFSTILQSLRPSAHVVAPQGMYFAGLKWLHQLHERGAIQLTIIDPNDPKALQAALANRVTDLVWIETALNPTWKVMDIKATANLAHAAGAILAVDSTVTPPVTCQPLSLGADLVFHSATKYLNGHSDVLGGAVATADKTPLWENIVENRALMGSTIGPFEAWLLLRGMRTLAVRFERCSANAMAIAEHFETHEKLDAILYHGLESSPDHTLATAQFTNGHSGMLSLMIKGGFKEALMATKALKLFLPATSLGGVESLAEHRKTIEGDLSDVPPNLIRLSVGIEAAEDLIADIEQALSQI